MKKHILTDGDSDFEVLDLSLMKASLLKSSQENLELLYMNHKLVELMMENLNELINTSIIEIEDIELHNEILFGYRNMSWFLENIYSEKFGVNALGILKEQVALYKANIEENPEYITENNKTIH